MTLIFAGKATFFSESFRATTCVGSLRLFDIKQKIELRVATHQMCFSERSVSFHFGRTHASVINLF